MPDLEFRLLGPLAVVRDDKEVDLGGRRRRAALALLLLELGRPVPTDRIVDRLWGESPPAGAVGTLQSYISRLRGALEPDRKAGGASTVLVSEASGYVLRAQPEQIDAQRFEKLADEGSAALAAGRPEDAEALLSQALELWHGPALAEFAYESWAQPAIERLETRRLAALEDRAAALLALGRHAAVAGELTELVSRYPTSERLRGHHALALYRSGRQVEALDSLRAARDVLREELGLDPGPELRELEERILNQDPELAAVPATAPTQPQGGRPRRAAPPAAPADTGFVGREAELAGLESALERAAEGQGGVALVAGHAGIGKTRLMERSASLARANGFATVWGSCYESDDPPPFWPWVRVVRQAAEQLGDDALSPSARMFLGQLVPELAEGMPAGPATAANADTARYQLYEAVAQLLAQLSRTAPLLVVLDDVHWADPASCGLLELVATQARDLPMVIAVTYRPGEQDPDGPLTRTLAVLGRVGPIQRVELRGLGVEDLERLIAPSYPDEAALVATVHERTDGNPFFATELVRLLEEGDTHSEEERRTLARTAVPTGVKDVLLRRLERLPPESRRALELAAAVGRDFDVGLLADALGTDRMSLAEALDATIASGLVVSADGDQLGSLRFSHALVREAVGAALGPTALARAHARVAQALIAREPLDDDGIELLANHVWNAAGLLDPAESAARIVKAGDVAMKRLAYERAEELFIRAGRLRADLPERPENLEADLAGNLRLAALWMMTRGLAGPGVREVLDDARGIAERLGQTGLLVRVLATAVMHDVPAGEFRNAQAAGQAALAPAESSGSPIEVALAHFAIGSVKVHTGDVDGAREHLRRSVAELDRAESVRARSSEELLDVLTLRPDLWIPSWLGIAEGFGGDEEAADAAFRRVEQDMAGADVYTRLGALGFKTWVWVVGGRTDRVREATEQGLSWADPYLYPLWGAGNLCYHGWSVALQGEPEAGLDEFDRGVALWQGIGLGMLHGFWAGIHAEILLELGERESARERCEWGIEHSRAIGEVFYIPALLRIMSATREDPAEARADLEEAIRAAREMGIGLLERRARDALDTVESTA